MNVAIVHYHFNRGGVTQVVTNHLRALDATRENATPLRVAILSGGRHEGAPDELLTGFGGLDPQRLVIEELDYDAGHSHDSVKLATRLRDELASIGFLPDDTVLHVHNHGLGKNQAVPAALAELAREGFGLLLHIHDFAEDFRPDNYAQVVASVDGDAGRVPELLYPQAARIHYAVLNGRDRGVLAATGVPESRLHDLPNPVAEFVDVPDAVKTKARFARTYDFDPARRLVLYPVRGIRRKNLGEILLWSALAMEQSVFAITLAPLNPVEQPTHDTWRAFAGQLDLPCLFDVGGNGGFSFVENLAACDQIITTSVAEGFGMVFLESWLAQRPLVGRDLPEITADFVKAGVRFDHLGTTLLVPVAWMGRDKLTAALRAVYLKVLAAYELPPPAHNVIENQLDALMVEESIDFASCPRDLQAEIVRLVATEPRRRETVFELNPWLRAALAAERESEADAIAHNASVVRKSYSLAECGHRLRGVYADVLACPPVGEIVPPRHGDRVLASFLAVSRLRPIRLEA